MQIVKEGEEMSCEICGRGSCSRCFHPIDSQEEYDRLVEQYGAGHTLSELLDMEEEQEDDEVKR